MTRIEVDKIWEGQQQNEITLQYRFLTLPTVNMLVKWFQRYGQLHGVDKVIGINTSAVLGTRRNKMKPNPFEEMIVIM
jgi:hypothetical protein